MCTWGCTAPSVVPGSELQLDKGRNKSRLDSASKGFEIQALTCFKLSAVISRSVFFLPIRMSYRLLSYSCLPVSLRTGFAVSGRRRCQSKEGNGDMAGENCSELKMDTGQAVMFGFSFREPPRLAQRIGAVRPFGPFLITAEQLAQLAGFC